ncbi:hypothetical protein R3X28_07840 [Maribacter sp. TH_r10]|uniref:hypothetical protein n=1 Tax=Maribacter sp. TH_r10 TaxID=3082086 RepID=UPI0029559235|nr:hypothetical protein [Maribacter sp. TH_r10]MDV7138783.1 hypothetical protein [Maribacter sp. TH_r10]
MCNKLCLFFLLAIQLSFAQSRIEGYVKNTDNEPKAYAQLANTHNDQRGPRFLVNNLFNEIGHNAYRTSYINQTDPRNLEAVVTYMF